MKHRILTWGYLLLAATVADAASAIQEPSEETPEEIRARVLATPIGTMLAVDLRSGETFAGELAETRADAFGIWLDDDATRERLGLPGGKLRKWFPYTEVRALRGAPTVALNPRDLQYRMRIGDDVRVRTTRGETVKGEVEDFDGTVLVLDGRSFRLADGEVEQIQLRVTDSLRNGVLIGAGIGVGLVALACSSGCDADIAIVGGLFYAGVGAGLGALFDALDTESRVIYSAPRTEATWSLAPYLKRDKKGVVFSLRF